MDKTFTGGRAHFKAMMYPSHQGWGGDRDLDYPGAVQATNLAALNPEAFFKLWYIATDILLTNAKLLKEACKVHEVIENLIHGLLPLEYCYNHKCLKYNKKL